MKIAEIKGDYAIEVLAEIIDPVSTILADKEVKEAAKGTKMDAIKIVLKKYPKEITRVLALLEGEDPNTYEPSLLSIPKKLIEITEDEDVKSLFTSAAQTAEKDASGNAQATTKDKA